MQLGLKDFKRFEKQIILKNVGVAGQKKILNAKVLIIGIGGLGCPLLTYLAASGVGTIGIADPDKVEISNLNRQTLFNTNDIGKYKVDQAKTSINRINKKIKIKTFIKKITLKNYLLLLIYSRVEQKILMILKMEFHICKVMILKDILTKH